MIPKILTAVISAALLAVVLGTLPSEAIGAEKSKRHPPKQPVAEHRVGAGSLNSPSTDFSTVSPQIDAPDRDQVAPKRDRNQFFNQKE